MDQGPTIATAATRPSETRERSVAAVCAVLLIGLALAWATQHRLAAFTSPQFATFYGTTLTLCALFAAILLIWRARLIGDAASARVAAAFVFCVPLVAVYALTYPGVIAAFASQRQASGWLWFAWRIGWAVALVWYAVRPNRPRGNLRRSSAVALGAALLAMVVSFSGIMPEWYQSSTGAFLPAVYAAYSITGLVMLGAIICLLRMRPMSSLNTWLIVVLTANTAVAFLYLFSRVRFEGASDASRLLAIASAAILVWVLVSEFARLLSRASSLDRFMTMAQYASNIVYLLDKDGTCLYMNRRWTEVTGQSSNAALGSGWHAAVHPDDLAAGFPDRATGIASGQRYEHQLRFRSADGTYRWHLSTGTPAYDGEGRIDGWYGMSTDIDDQRRALERVAVLYQRERQIAQTLQSVFLPPFLPQLPSAQFQAVYRPALRETELGGDWYDAFVLSDGRIAVSIGDVAGHGIDAAIAMMRLRETLRAVTSLVDGDPDLILQTADRAFIGTHPDIIATAVFGLYDPATRRFTYSSAGHPPPALVRNGTTTFLPCETGLPLGVDAESVFTPHHAILEPDDVLVLYTDGLIEVDDDLFASERRFTEILARNAGNCEQIVSETLGGQQRDDVALLTMSVRETAVHPSWHFKSDDAINASDARFAFVAHLERRNIDEAVRAQAELVFGELVANVVRHAPGPIEIELTWQGNRPQLVVRDRGPRFDIGDLKLPDNDLSESGRGLFLIAAVASPPVITGRPGGGNDVAVTLVTEESEATSLVRT